MEGRKEVKEEEEENSDDDVDNLVWGKKQNGGRLLGGKIRYSTTNWKMESKL